MGFLDRFRRIKDPVRGSAQVVGLSHAPDAATSGTCRMDLVVTVPGHDAFSVTDKYIVQVSKWPSYGTVLPIEASASNPSRFKILWDEVRTWTDRSSERAQALADAINQGGSPVADTHTFTATAPGVSAVIVNGRPATPDDLKQYEAMTGLDLDGDGKVGQAPVTPGHGLQDLIATALAGSGVAPPAGPAASGGGDDRVDALERLAALRESGALTDAEFDAEKARILGAK